MWPLIRHLIAYGHFTDGRTEAVSRFDQIVEEIKPRGVATPSALLFGSNPSRLLPLDNTLLLLDYYEITTTGLPSTTPELLDRL